MGNWIKGFIIPIRNWNWIGVDEWETESKIYNTYKELKLGDEKYKLEGLEGFIIPIRNWNFLNNSTVSVDATDL